MKKNQKQAIEICRPKLINGLDLGITIDLRAAGVLSKSDLERIDRQSQTSEEKRNLLLDIIIDRDNAWDKFLAALTKRRQNFLKDQLERTLLPSNTGKNLHFVTKFKRLRSRFFILLLILPLSCTLLLY